MQQSRSRGIRSISRQVLVTIKVSMLKSKYVHRLRPCNANVIIISSDFIDYVEADILE